MPYEEEAPDIAARAFAALGEGDLETAESLSLQLRELRYSAHFEIQALIHLEKRELEQAIEVLQEGVQVAPAVWLLWQLLGNSLSDNSQFEEAMACYDHALLLDLERSDRESIVFNQATLLSRLNREKEALAFLDSLDHEETVEDGILQINIELLRISIWSTSHRCDNVAMRATQLEELLRASEQAPESDFRDVSMLWSRGALTLLQCGFIARARAWSQAALEAFIANEQALEILRLSDSNALLANRHFQVLLEGIEGDDGFFVSYSVVARDASEAQTLALAMATPHHASEVSVVECKPLGKCDKTPIGVYEIGPHNLFPLDSEE